MRASTAYFIGAGTIIAAIAIGLGGGIVAGNIMNPVAPKQGPDTSKVAQRAEAAAPANSSAPSERVQYLTGSQAFGTVIAAPAQAEAVKPDIQPAEVRAEPPPQQAPQAAAAEPPRPAPATPPPKPAEQQAAAVEPSSSPDNAYAKARDTDMKRAAVERRRSERRERWAERRHYDVRESRGLRDRTDWDDVARNVREDSETRDVAGRQRGGFPQIRLFDADD